MFPFQTIKFEENKIHKDLPCFLGFLGGGGVNDLVGIPSLPNDFLWFLTVPNRSQTYPTGVSTPQWNPTVVPTLPTNLIQGQFGYTPQAWVPKSQGFEEWQLRGPDPFGTHFLPSIFRGFFAVSFFREGIDGWKVVILIIL